MKLRNKKTGEIVEGESHAVTIWRGYGNNPSYNSLAELNEEWEDYAPAEPLIKDKRVRKAVRAWAEVNSIKEALYSEKSDRSFCILTDMSDDDYDIDLVGWIPTLDDGGIYTIAELCGEGE